MITNSSPIGGRIVRAIVYQVDPILRRSHVPKYDVKGHFGARENCYQLCGFVTYLYTGHGWCHICTADIHYIVGNLGKTDVVGGGVSVIFTDEIQRLADLPKIIQRSRNYADIGAQLSLFSILRCVGLTAGGDCRAVSSVNRISGLERGIKTYTQEADGEDCVCDCRKGRSSSPFKMPLIALAALVLCRVVVAIEGVDCPGDISIFGGTGIASVAATALVVWCLGHYPRTTRRLGVRLRRRLCAPAQRRNQRLRYLQWCRQRLHQLSWPRRGVKCWIVTIARSLESTWQSRTANRARDCFAARSITAQERRR